MDRHRTLSLVLPAFNEAAGIREAVLEADAALRTLASQYEILVVDDGSSDQTAALVAEITQKLPQVRLLRHAQNRGYGAALRTGFAAARFELVAFTDADCQFHLEDLGPLLVLTDTHPIAVGYRVARQDPWRRKFFSWGYNVLVRALLGTRVRDCDCALKVFRRDALARLLPESPGFFVNTEMLTRARQLGLAVAEAGVRHRPRLRGQSTVSLAQVPRVLGELLPFWWTQSLFPSRSEAEPARSVWAFPLVLLVAAVLFFSRLTTPLLEPQEARYAEIPRQMLERGQLLVPVLHGQAYLDKPPLFYWLVAGSYRLFGPQDWAARLIPGLAGLLTVAVCFWWARQALGERAALAAALVLCLSARFVYLGRLVVFDGLLTLLVTSSLACAHLAMCGGELRRGLWLMSALACGLGILTKGAVAVVLVLPPVLLVLALDRRLARPSWRAWAGYLMLAVGVAAPWFVLVEARHPGFVADFFWRHHVQRYVKPFDHEEPAWFYLPGLVLGTLPWALLLPGLVRTLLRHSRRAARRRPPELGFFLLCFAWGVLFFSVSGCKRAVYILPAFPPLALALGCYLEGLLPRRQASLSALVRPAPASALAWRAAVLALALGAGAGGLAVLAELLPVFPGLTLSAAFVAGLAIVGGRDRRRFSWAGPALATFVVLLAGLQVLMPAYAERFALREAIREQAAQTPPEVPVACYPRSWDSVGFYLRRSIGVYGDHQKQELIRDLRRQPRTLMFIKSGRPAEELLRSLPAGVRFELLGRHAGVTWGWAHGKTEVRDDHWASLARLSTE